MKASYIRDSVAREDKYLEENTKIAVEIQELNKKHMGGLFSSAL
jgi:hypothetical protein